MERVGMHTWNVFQVAISPRTPFASYLSSATCEKCGVKWVLGATPPCTPTLGEALKRAVR